MFIKLLILSLLLATPITSFAEDIILDADERVEYHQKDQKLVAKGNAKARKGNMSISADTLIGYYTPDNKNKISRIEAIGNVTMKTTDTVAGGDKMIYDIKSDSAVLSGNPAIIKSPEFTIKSKGPITYYQSEQKAVANDGVEAIDNKNNHVYADLMTAWFEKDENQKLALNKIDIQQNVKITSKDTVVTALKGTYNAKNGNINLYDDVTIDQHGNILKGSKAETNLNTGISKILSGGEKNKVRGVFKEKKKKE